MAFRLAELFVDIRGRTNGLDATLSSVRGRLAGLAGMRFSIPGGGLAGALGLGGLGLSLGQAIKSAVDMEDRVAMLGKAADLSGGALAAMKGEIVDLSTTLKGVRLDALFDIATSGAKMGVATGDLVRYTEGVAKVSMAIDDLPAGEIADRIGKLNSVFKLGVDGTMQFGSAIDKLADSGVSSASGILDVLSRISGTAVVSRVTAQEATALAAALLDTGSGAELAATSLSRLIGSLNDAGSRAGFLKATGRDANSFAKLVKEKPMAALQEFLGALKGMNAGGQMNALAAIGIDGVQAQGEIMKLAQQTDTLSKYVGMANNEFRTLDQITKSYGASTSLTSSQLATMQNRIQVISSDIGTAMLPVVNSAVAAFGDLTTAMTSTSESGQTSFGKFLAWVQEALESAGAAFRNWGDVIEYTGEWIYGKIQNIGETFVWLKDVLGEVGRVIGVTAFNMFDRLWTAGKNAIDNLKILFAELWDFVKSGGTDAIDLSKTKGLLDGAAAWQDADFELPKLQLSDNAERLLAIQDRMANNEIGRSEQATKAKAAADAAKQAGGAAAQPAPDGRSFSMNSKIGITDVDSYARELAEAALKAGSGGDAAERTAKGVEAAADQLVSINEKLGRNGGKTPAVFA